MSDLVDELAEKADFLNGIVWDLNAKAETSEREARKARAIADAVKKELEGTKRQKVIVQSRRQERELEAMN
jgi:hypothetical protein